ncbi:MAG: dihydrolipoamide acetyltransferase, partial [Fuerstia sp.]|nr:dihydrolipoamide acetyltransferase [Fuerstiella sp.]
MPMSIEFKLPEVSEGVTTVDVAEVRVKEGDVIEAGAIVCEVETDKAVAEINCPHAGRISKLLIKSGDKLNVGQPILMIEATNGVAAASKPAAAPATKNATASDVPAAKPAPSPAPSPAAKPSAQPAAASGPVDFRLPEVSEGVTKVDIASVNVKVGDTITSGAVVCEVETDKAVAEINCPHAGTITAVHIKPGTSINIGSPLITINATSSVAAPAAKAPAATPAAAVPTVVQFEDPAPAP